LVLDWLWKVLGWNMWANLKHRSYEPELLDADTIDSQVLSKNLKEIAFINKWLGGDHVSIKGIRKIIGPKKIKNLRFADIGCGSGDTLQLIAKWGSKRKIDVILTGIDLKKECIDLAKETITSASPVLIQSDYRDVDLTTIKPDIIHASLFLHHLTDESIIEFLKNAVKHATIGVVINDLHRHPLAYYSIKWITRLFPSSYLVRNDAPLSVWRAFSRKEIEKFCLKAQVTEYSITWHWAFRWLLVIKTNSVEQK